MTSDTRFRTFLKAFVADVLTGMSGGLSVPFAAAALWVSNPVQKTLWACLAIAGALFGSYRVWRKATTSADDIMAVNAKLETQIAELKDNADNRKRKLIADIISELESNLATATNPHSGLPGNQVYLSPSVECWRSARNDLTFLDDRTMNALKEIYRRTERWRGIVASGINPGIGNQDVSNITVDLRRELPEMLIRLHEIESRM